MDPTECRFTENHEWAREEEGIIVMGISDYAQQEMSDIVFVELPEVGKRVNKGEEIATIESTKTASAIHAPLEGEIKDVNSELEGSPDLLNQSPYDDGWIAKLIPDSPEELDSLLSYEEYQKLCEES